MRERWQIGNSVQDGIGRHVHQDQIEQGKLDPKQGQADEMRIKARGMLLWMAMVMVVPTRFWVGGIVSKTRDSHLIDCLMYQFRRCCQDLCSLLICTDGFAAYPKSILRVFREKVKNKHVLVVTFVPLSP
jgi:hypothetical protein